MPNLTAYIEPEPESEFYVGQVSGLPNTHTQAASLDGLTILEEVIALLLEEDPELRDRPPRFVGFQQLGIR